MRKKFFCGALVACCLCTNVFGIGQSYFSVPDVVWNDFSRKITTTQTENVFEDPLMLVQLADGSYARASDGKTPRLEVNTPVPVLWSKDGQWSIAYINHNSILFRRKNEQADAIQIIGLKEKNNYIALSSICATQKNLKAFVGIECDDRYGLIGEIISKNPLLSRIYISRSKGASLYPSRAQYEYLLTSEGRKQFEHSCPDVIDIAIDDEKVVARVTTHTDAVAQISDDSNGELHPAPVVDLLPHRCKYDAYVIKLEGLNENDTMLALFGILSTQFHLNKIIIKNCKLSSARRKILSLIFGLYIPWTLVDITLQDDDPLVATMEQIDTIGRNYTINTNTRRSKQRHWKTKSTIIKPIRNFAQRLSQP